MLITGSGSVFTRVEDNATAWVMGGMMDPRDAPITMMALIFS